MLIFFSFLIFLIICYICFKLTFVHSKKDNNIYNLLPMEDYQIRKDYFNSLIDQFNSINYEDVYIKSHDGLKLHGRYYHYSDNSPVAICFHGYRGTSVRDFCGGAQFCLQQKQNVLVVDQRSHGLSEGHVISFGIKERYDVVK